MKQSFLILFAVFAFLISGCFNPAAKLQLPYPLPSGPAFQQYVAGTSVENQPIDCIVLGEGDDVILILAAIHGDEKSGIPLVLRLSKYLQDNPHLLDCRKVVLVPVANPDGVTHNYRFNARGVDLNRNFFAAGIADTYSPENQIFAEPENRALEQLIQKYNPNRIVTIHQPLACIDYDGPGELIAAAMAEYCPLPVRKLGARPASLGSFAGVILDIPVITIELTEEDSLRSPDALWNLYGRTLLAAIVYPVRYEK